MSLFSNFEDWVSHSAWPTIKTFFGGLEKAEVAAVAPLAQQGIAELTAEEATALATGDAKDTGHILAKVVASTTQKMQVAGITAAAPSVLAAVGAAQQQAAQQAASQ